MRQQTLAAFILLFTTFLFNISCRKEAGFESPQQQEIIGQHSPTPAQPHFNLEVILRGEVEGFGLVKFRQDVDAAKIITLDTKVRDLLPNHAYQLQRAVDVILDGNCTGTNWLTLGKGLTPQSILTDDKGKGTAELWRSVSALASGATFDIHFRVIDAVSKAVVLTSDCYQYTVR